MTHGFDVEIALKYGVNAAILLRHIAFWIQKNRANGEHFHDGYTWTYSSYSAFVEIFPYMGMRQVRTALSRLADDGVIITGNYSKFGRTNTLWYAITPKGEALLQHKQESNDSQTTVENSPCQNDTQPIKMTSSPCQNDTVPCQNDTHKTDITTDIGVQINNPHNPPSGNEDDTTRERDRQEELFAEFYSEYPRKVGREKAWKIWRRLSPSHALHEKIMAALRGAKGSYDWTKAGGQYVPYPATWLNRKGWEDEYMQNAPPSEAASYKPSVHKDFMRHNYTAKDLEHIGIDFSDDDE